MEGTRVERIASGRYGRIGKRTKLTREQAMAAIQDAAIIEFSQQGFTGASTQAIAERAGLTKSQLHYYIDGKESLFDQILSHLLDTWAELSEFDEHHVDPAKALTRYVRRKLEFSLDQPELSRIFTTEMLSGGHRLQRHWPRMIELCERKLAVIDGWIAAGKLVPMNSRLLLMHIWALTQYYADYALQAEKMLGAPLDTPPRRAELIDELTAFVLRGCGIAPLR